MKILQLTTHLNTGGITSYLLTLCSGLKHNGHEVFIISSGGNVSNRFQKFGCTVIEKNIRTKSELSPKIYLALSSIKKLINDENIDVIHTHTRITQVMGEILAKQTGCVHVSTCHGYFRQNIGRKLFPCWGKETIAISKEVKKHLINDLGREEREVKIINSGIDVDQFHKAVDSEAKELRQKYNLNDELIIGIIARLSDVKGIDILITAMRNIVKRLPNIKLLIVGQGKEEALLKKMVKENKLNESIQFLPIVENTSELLSFMDIFIMPSRQEGLGLSIMEAQASSLPVVASNVGGIPTLIENNKTGVLVAKENPDELANAILRLAQDKKKRSELGNTARSFIQNNYSSERMVNETIEFYQSVLNS